MLSRRKFLSRLGIGVAAVPILAFLAPETAAAASDSHLSVAAPTIKPRTENRPSSAISGPRSLITVHTAPLTEGVPPSPLDINSIFDLTEPLEDDYRTYWIRPKIMFQPVEQSSRYDPLGQYGFIAVKFWVGDKQYGDWIKFSDVVADNDGLFQEGRELLKLYSEEKLRRIDPHARFYSF